MVGMDGWCKDDFRREGYGSGAVRLNELDRRWKLIVRSE